MKAAVYYTNGGPDVFRYEDIAEPVCAHDEVLIEVEAISVEGGDLINREQRPLARMPHTVGYQCAGTVTTTGRDVESLSRGDRVTAILPWGSHAEFAVAKERNAWRIPQALSSELAAVVPVAWGTASECLFELGLLSAGDTVLIHGASGALGVAAIQLAKHAGARVIGTSSSEEKLGRLEEFGLDIGIDTSASDFVEAVRDATDGEGVELVLDSVGGLTLAKSIQACRYRGRVVTVGVSGRDIDRPDPVSLWRGNKSLQGIYFPDALANENARVHAEVTGILADIARGLFEVVIDREFPLSEAEAAHRYVLSRQGFGRVIMRP